MASTLVESPSEINQLFRDISSKVSPAESEDVVKSSKRIYGEQFKSLENQDLLSCLYRLFKFGYVSSKNLTLIKEFIATRSNNQHDINKRVEDFEISHPSQPKLEKELHGRTEEFKEITEKLKMNPFVVNLHGSAGVGKTTLARNICDKWTGKKYVFDLREAKDMTAVYLNIMGELDLNIQNVRLDMSNVVGRIHDLLKVTSRGPSVLLLLDNVDQFTDGKGKEGENLRTQFLNFLGKLSEFDGEKGSLNVLLTSRTQLKNSGKVADFELQRLSNNFSEKILLPTEAIHVEAQQKKKLLDFCKGVPLLLKGAAAILKQGRKSPSDLIDEIEMKRGRKEEAGVPVKSKYEEDTEERSFNSQEEGIDDEQISVIREMFYTLPSDTLRVSAVSVSLFHGPFTAATAAKILDVSMSEAVAQLEGLVTNEIIHVVDEDAKQLMYDIHPLLRKYAESIQSDAMFYESYTEAKGRFYEHFMSKMKRIAGLIESSYIRAFNEFKRDRPNFEFAIDIALLPEYFIVPGGYHESALIVSLFNAMLSGKKQTKLFHSWAEMCKDDGNLGSLFRSQLRCWEARLVSESQGAQKAFEVLEKASTSLKQVDDKSTESFKLTQGLYLYFQGEIYYQNRDYHKAIECLESSLDLMEGPLKLDTNVARCYNALGNCYYGLDRPEKALEFYNKALKMREELSGSDYHYDMPVYKNQIGTVHEDKGEYEDAVNCYKDALELLEDLKCLGYEDEALFRRNLANVYVRQEKYKEAEKEAKKALKIRLKILGNHPDTVRSIFQLGVIQANLMAYDIALDFFLKAWEMEKLLGAGNQSAVWRRIIKGVFDMHKFLKEKGAEKEKEEFRQDALAFCERFWEEEKASPQFNFTAYNKEIIDAILYLLEKRTSMFGLTDKKEKALIDTYEREALWFYDRMQGITEESFNNEFDGARDNKVLNELLRERTAFLDKLIEFCSRHDKHEKLRKHKQGKMALFKKVLVRSDFVGEKSAGESGEKNQEKSTLRKAVEDLYEDFGEKGSIKGFRENLLTTWQRQWEEGKGKEESREHLLTRWRIIKGILKLCEELEMKDLRKRYGKEALSFGDRLLEIRRGEMKNVEIKGLLIELKEVASSIGDRKRKNAYRDALQALKKEKEAGPGLIQKVIQALTPQVLRPEKKPSPEQTPKSGSEEEEEFEADEDIGAMSSGATQVEESEAVATEVSEEALEVMSEEEVEVGSEAVFKGTVTSEGTNWPVKQGGVLVMFPRDAVSEPTPILVHRKYSACSPPLQEHEAITSNVIELSSISGQDQRFNTKVKLSLSHSAPDLHGYELVIKRLIDRENNKWEDLDGTRDVRCRQEIEDVYPSHMEIPDLFFPFAQVDITECSTYAVVCRLKASPTYTITSKGGSFSHPDYPGVTVTIPENAVGPNAEFPLQLKVQEVPNDEFEGGHLVPGPVLRINCSEAVQFIKPVTIQLPISLREQQVLTQVPTTCRVRVLFLKSDDGPKKWIEITDDLVKPASFDGKFVNIYVERFSGYFPLLDLAFCSAVEVGVKSFLTHLIKSPPRPADFVAYFCQDIQNILHLICCPSHVTGKVIGDLKENDITPFYGSSDMDMIPGHHRAFVHLSEGICPSNEEDLKNLYLMLREEQPFKKDLRVRLFNNNDSARVEFYRTSDQRGRTTLCKFYLTIPTQSTDHTVNAVDRPSISFDRRPLRVTLLGDEWGSSKGGLSTLNRELAKHLARQSDVEVTVLLLRYDEKEKREADEFNVHLATPEVKATSDCIMKLCFPSDDLNIDVVIGHGQKLGVPAQVLAKQRKCIRVHIVHTASEELAMFKEGKTALPKGEEKHQAELELCRKAEIVAAIGPKLAEAISAPLRSYCKDQHVIDITPGIFPEFEKLEQASDERGKFRILVFGRGDSEDFELKGYDIAAQAVAGLNDKSYRLIFVGAPKGKEEEVKNRLLECGIPSSQLIVRGFVESRDTLKRYFCEADLAVMPSRTEGFGLTALEALSAGLPILVSENSGLGEAIKSIPFGRAFVVDSINAEDWGKAITHVRETQREIRLKEACSLREAYDKKYKWETQCERLVKKMRASLLVHSRSKRLSGLFRRFLSV